MASSVEVFADGVTVGRVRCRCPSRDSTSNDAVGEPRRKPVRIPHHLPPEHRQHRPVTASVARIRSGTYGIISP